MQRDREDSLARRDRKLEGLVDPERTTRIVEVVAHVATLPRDQHAQRREQLAGGKRPVCLPRIVQGTSAARVAATGPRAGDRRRTPSGQRAARHIGDEAFRVAVQRLPQVDEVDRRNRAQHAEPWLGHENAAGGVRTLVRIVDREDPIRRDKPAPHEPRQVLIVEAGREPLGDARGRVTTLRGPDEKLRLEAARRWKACLQRAVEDHRAAADLAVVFSGYGDVLVVSGGSGRHRESEWPARAQHLPATSVDGVQVVPHLLVGPYGYGRLERPDHLARITESRDARELMAHAKFAARGGRENSAQLRCLRRQRIPACGAEPL